MQEWLELADLLEHSSPTTPALCFIGFDGVSDELLDVVESREGANQYAAMQSMANLANRILQSAGKSCNIEVVSKRRKLGGNGPILANALLEGNHKVILAGTLGEKEIEPLFDSLAKRCLKVYTLGASAYTQALEFSDGKVMVGKLLPLNRITYENLLTQIPKKELLALHEELDLFVSANWTMVLGTNDIWRGLLTDLVPNLTKRPNHKPRWMFVDLADPAKRTDSDLQQGLALLQGLTRKYCVILGLNESEGGRVAKLLGCEAESHTPEQASKMVQAIHSHLGLAQVVCHTTKFAVACTSEGIFSTQGPYTPTPKITTGGGDNFNAGYCNGLLYKFTVQQSLLSGVSTSGFYVRNGWSPNMKELAQFLRLWHAQSQ